MLTNKLNIEFNLEEIVKDYDIYKVVKGNKDLYKSNILDSIRYDFKAEAVQWAFGDRALLLFKKDSIKEREFKHQIMEEYNDVIIDKFDINEDNPDDFFFKEKRVLAQLMFNSMHNTENERFKYNNLTGRLLYRAPFKENYENSIYISFVEIFLNAGFYLSLNVVTYQKNNHGDYLFDEKTGYFRKKLKKDKDFKGDTYLKKSMKDHHKTISALSIKSISLFENTKMGILARFLKDVQDNLSKYLTITLANETAFNEFEYTKDKDKHQKYGNLFKQRPIAIIDENHSERSKEIVEELKNDLFTDYGITDIKNSLTKDAYNIQIVYDKEYYEKNKINDPYKEKHDNYIIQHLIEENIPTDYNARRNIINTIIKELIIKSDVLNNHISIYDWNSFSNGLDWYFVSAERIKSEDKKNPKFKYYRLHILPNGDIAFDENNSMNINDKSSMDWQIIDQHYINDVSYKAGNSIEGLFYTDINNIQTILLTEENIIPNVKALSEALRKTDKNNEINIEILNIALDAFNIEYPEYSESTAIWKEEINKHVGIISNKDLLNIIPIKSKQGKLFNTYLKDGYDIWMHGEYRSKKNEEIYNLYAMKNIKYWDDIDSYNIKSNKYSVFPDSLKNEYSKLFPVRKIVSTINEPNIKSIIPLLAVDFIREGQYTVLPFPFKYLREYINKEK